MLYVLRSPHARGTRLTCGLLVKAEVAHDAATGGVGEGNAARWGAGGTDDEEGGIAAEHVEVMRVRAWHVDTIKVREAGENSAEPVKLHWRAYPPQGIGDGFMGRRPRVSPLSPSWASLATFSKAKGSGGTKRGKPAESRGSTTRQPMAQSAVKPFARRALCSLPKWTWTSL